MKQFFERDPLEQGFASGVHPIRRIQDAVALYWKQPVGLVWCTNREHANLKAALGLFCDEDRAKVVCVHREGVAIRPAHLR